MLQKYCMSYTHAFQPWRGVTDWYQSIGYSELGGLRRAQTITLEHAFKTFFVAYAFTLHVTSHVLRTDVVIAKMSSSFPISTVCISMCGQPSDLDRLIIINHALVVLASTCTNCSNKWNNVHRSDDSLVVQVQGFGGLLTRRSGLGMQRTSYIGGRI